MNKKLNKDIETIFLMSDVENQIISSRFVKEISKLNGNIAKFVTKSAINAIKKKINEKNSYLNFNLIYNH